MDDSSAPTTPPHAPREDAAEQNLNRPSGSPETRQPHERRTDNSGGTARGPSELHQAASPTGTVAERFEAASPHHSHEAPASDPPPAGTGSPPRVSPPRSLELGLSRINNVLRGPPRDAPASGDGPVQRSPLNRAGHAIATFAKFVGPGFMIAVAYIDPGNYATDISAGASYRFQLLFIVLLSNLFAILLQGLCIKLGTVTGLNLAEACRAFLPKWLNFILYIMAEVAIIATDIAEVIGTAIAINLLIPQIPLLAGCAISILDVMIILLFYNPKGSMRGLRAFEAFVVALVLAVVVCFCIQMSFIRSTTVGEVFRGYLPSAAIVQQQGLYQACGILGATVMPHSLYLGSGMPQSRLREYDVKKGLQPADRPGTEESDKITYIPSLAAIRHCWKYSITELTVSLFTFALFINSAILIIAGASLYGSEEAQGSDIFAIHGLLARTLGKGAGILFALALLLSGLSAGIVCTIAGQMVSEGALDWHMRPWLRRLMTRSISITPSIIIAGAVGRAGLDAALNGSQVALSVVLPFVSAPLIYFTCMSKYMKVSVGRARTAVVDDDEDPSGLATMTVTVSASAGRENVKMANSIPVVIISVLVWLVIAAMNVANLVLLGLGKE